MGTFDLLHPGHLHLLRWCRRLAGAEGEVVATVNSDAFVERYKGRRPVMNEAARRAMVLALPEVDECEVHGDLPAIKGADEGGIGPGYPGVMAEDASSTIKYRLPRGGLLVIGADWRDRDYLAQLGVTQEWLDERGIVVVYVPLLAGYSSTKLREAMAPDGSAARAKAFVREFYPDPS